MSEIGSILVATDFSEHARFAALRAAGLGARRGVLLHVVPEVRLEPDFEVLAVAAIERALAELAAELEREAGFAFEPRVASGAAADEIARAAKDFDLVVVGARGLHPLRDFAIGTSAQRLLRRSRRPVLVVKRRPEGAYRQVLAPVDFSADSRAAVALARALAPDAELNLAHAFEVDFEGRLRLAGVPDETIHGYRRQARTRAAGEMETLIAELGLPPARVTRVIEHGYPPTRIAEAEKRIGADLVAIGKHGHSRLEDLLLGSVTLHVLAGAGCDVLIARAPT